MKGPATALQFRVERPGHGAIVRVPLAAPGPGEVLVRSRYSGVSRGTESLVFNGRIPPDQYQAMRAPFQQGEFPGPVAYGYMNVGEVVAGPDALAGRTVFCLHPHQDDYIVPADAVVPLPDDLPAGRGVLAANMETAINAVWDGRPGPGDRIVVVGGGVIGHLVAWLCQGLPGAAVTLVDPLPERGGSAARLGIRHATVAPDEPADLVFHASATAAGLDTALAAAGLEATVIELSWFGDAPVPAPLGRGFHSRRLTLRSSQVGRLPAERQPRWDHRRRLSLALDLLRDARLDALISGESPFETLPALMPELAQGAGATLCHRIRYPDPGS